MSNDDEIEIKPPWIEFPDIHPYDIFWRMGFGEEYIEKISNYLNNLSQEDLEKYKEKYPITDEDWSGWYDE